jgi:hypothetical protein
MTKQHIFIIENNIQKVHVGRSFFNLSRRTTVIQDLLVRRQFLLYIWQQLNFVYFIYFSSSSNEKKNILNFELWMRTKHFNTWIFKSKKINFHSHRCYISSPCDPGHLFKKIYYNEYRRISPYFLSCVIEYFSNLIAVKIYSRANLYPNRGTCVYYKCMLYSVQSVMGYG